MRKLAALAALSLLLLVSGAGAATLAPGVKLRVTPAVGHRHTAFELEFTTPPGFGSSDREGLISVRGPGGAGCVSSETMNLVAGVPGSGNQVKLVPTDGRPWCVGKFQGTVEETVRPHCGPAQACPMFVTILRVGHFRFTVRR